MSSRELRLVVFDVDGTLVDSRQHILAAMREACGRAALPLPPDDERTLEVVGLSLPEAIARLLPGASAPLAQALARHYRDAFAELRATIPSPLFPGARAALARLAARDEVLVGIATGKSRRGLDHLLATHALDGAFHTIQVADGHPSKPHPSMLLAAMRETGVEARQVVMIGDTSYDIEMARNAGMPALGVSWGHHGADRLRMAGASAIVEDFDALSNALDRLWEVA